MANLTRFERFYVGLGVAGLVLQIIGMGLHVLRPQTVELTCLLSHSLLEPAINTRNSDEPYQFIKAQRLGQRSVNGETAVDNTPLVKVLRGS